MENFEKWKYEKNENFENWKYEKMKISKTENMKNMKKWKFQYMEKNLKKNEKNLNFGKIIIPKNGNFAEKIKLILKICKFRK